MDNPLLSPTYRLLADWPGDAATTLLITAAGQETASVACDACVALARRDDRRGHRWLVENPDRLRWISGGVKTADYGRRRQPDRDPCSWLTSLCNAPALQHSIDDVLRELLDRDQTGEADPVSWIEAAVWMNVFTALPRLIVLATSGRWAGGPAGGAVASLSDQLGRQCRGGNRHRGGLTSVRRDTLARLRSRLTETNRPEDEPWLIDAVLSLSQWSDGSLPRLLDFGGGVAVAVAERLTTCRSRGVVDLIASLPTRRTAAPALLAAWHTRTDRPLAAAILRTVGPRPPATVTQRLSELGLPPCLLSVTMENVNSDGENGWLSQTSMRLAAWRVLTAVASDDDQTLLGLNWAMRLLGRIESAADDDADVESGCESIRLGLAAGRVVSPRCWITAIEAIDPISVDVGGVSPGGDTAADRHRRTLWTLGRLIGLTDRPEPIGRVALQLLTPLTFENLLRRRDPVSPEVRTRLGRLVMRLDPTAVETLRDALRHPVLETRIEAIEWIASQGLLELMAGDLAAGIAGEHTRVRRRLAVRLGDETGAATGRLLSQLSAQAHPDVAEAACRSLARRSVGSP